MEKGIKEKRDKQIQLRVTESEKALLEKKYKEFGFKTLTEYLIYTGLNTVVMSKLTKK